MTSENQSTASEVRGIPEMPDVSQHAVKPNAPVVGTVSGTRVCTKSKKAAGVVRHIEIDVSGTPLENGWVSGQSFGVVPPGTDDKGRPYKLRLYSISSPTKGERDDGCVLSTTTKRLIDEDWDTHKLYVGACSNYLCDLDVGDKVHLTGPAGKRFVLPEDPSAHDYVFIATGTGIAPFRGMLADLAKMGMPSRADLIMGVPYETDLLYDDEMSALMETNPDRFGYHPVISRHTTKAQERPMYVQDKLALDPKLKERLRSDRTLIYVCGIAGMELGIFRTLAAVLDEDGLAQYLKVDPEIDQDPETWERAMIPRKLKPTKRMMLEVY